MIAQIHIVIRILIHTLLSVAVFAAGVLSASTFRCTPDPRPALASGETRIDTIRIDTVRRTQEQQPVRVQVNGTVSLRRVSVRDFDTRLAAVDSVATVTSDSTLTVRPFVAQSDTVFLPPIGAWFQGNYKFPENRFEFTVQPPPIVELEITRWLRETHYVQEQRPLWQDIATHALVAALTYTAVKTIDD